MEPRRERGATVCMRAWTNVISELHRFHLSKADTDTNVKLKRLACCVTVLFPACGRMVHAISNLHFVLRSPPLLPSLYSHALKYYTLPYLAEVGASPLPFPIPKSCGLLMSPSARRATPFNATGRTHHKHLLHFVFRLLYLTASVLLYCRLRCGSHFNDHPSFVFLYSSITWPR